MNNAQKARKNIKAGEEARAPFERVWAECDNYFAGEQSLLRRYNGDIFDARTIPAHLRRNRKVYNLLTARCTREISAYTALAQEYQVDPSPPVGSVSAEVAYQSAAGAAVAGERQLAHFDDDLDLNAKKAEAKQGAVVFGEAYAWPMFDSTVGKPIGNSGKYQGNACVKTLDGSQVAWEPGMKFQDSPWHSIECFYTRAEMVARWPEKYPNEEAVKADAISKTSISGAVMDNGHGDPNLVTVHYYIERPLGKNQGGLLVLAGDTVLEQEDKYPYDFDEVSNEPWLVRYTYVQPVRRSRARGMVEDLLDPQRGINRRTNQIDDWLDITAVPMVNIPEDIANRKKVVIKPGEHFITRPGISDGISFVTPGNPPQALFQMPENLKNTMDSISGQYDFTGLAGTSAAATVKQITDEDKSRQGEIARSFARSDSKLAIRLLLIAREHFTEPRELRYASRTQTGFVASKELPRRINVRVKTGQPQTRGQVQATAMQWGSMPWGIPPAKIMLAIQENDLGIITNPFKLDIDKQEREDEQIYALNPKKIEPMIDQFAQIMAEQLAQAQAIGAPFDPSQASPPPGPWPHAQPDDNDDLHIQVIDDWMKTREFDLAHDAIKQVARWHKSEHVLAKQQKAQVQAVAQEMQAQEQGAVNAARPGRPTQAPSQASHQSQNPESLEAA